MYWFSVIKCKDSGFVFYIQCTYICEMRNIEKDILEEGLFPKVDLSQIDDEVVKRYAGIIKDFPTQQDLDNDERLAMIWNR